MLREIFYRQFADIRRDEWPTALMLSAYFFLVIATFWILKPLKRGVIVNYFGDDPIHFFGMTFGGAEAEQIGKILNMVAVYLVVILFTMLVRRFARHHLTLIFAAIFSGMFVLFAALVDHLNDPVVWSFYVYGDMFNTVMVALFWAFTNDVVRSEQAKRMYGVIGLGGVVGGFVGATVVNSTVEGLGRAPLLLFCIVPMVIIVIIAYAVHARSKKTDSGEANERPAAPGRSASTALEGAKLVFTSKYLLAIMGIIATYELVSNIIDFQLAATIEQQIEADLEKDSFFALVGQLIGLVSIGVQLLLTAFVMKKFGIKAALLFLPVAILLGTTGFLVVPGLLFVAMMSVSDNALNYSINQSAKEALYVPTSQDVKYKAKAFIDMFVQRSAKVISVFLNLVFASLFVSGVRWLSLIVLAMLGLWVNLVRYVGNQFKKKADEEEVTAQAGSVS